MLKGENFEIRWRETTVSLEDLEVENGTKN